MKHLVLVGGGHAHALLLKQWGEDPLANVHLTLISPQQFTPYSGMLPGLVAGHYSVDQIHIDLQALCDWAQVDFIQDSVVDIDPNNKALQTHQHNELSYDCLSLNIGSTPEHSLPGVKQYATPVKPIAEFYQHWQKTLQQLRASASDQHIVMVGGGAGSIEIILAMQWAISQDSAIQVEVSFSLVTRGKVILPTYPNSVKKVVSKQLARSGINCFYSFDVKSVNEGYLQSVSDDSLNFDFLFWCTQASSASWLSSTGLVCNDEGFVSVNPALQSINYPDIFAAGDIAHMEQSPRPKAGVYAVRQAPFLFENLRCHLTSKNLTQYSPQDTFLGLLALGDQKAVASCKWLPALTGAWVWRWKNSIDQNFMNEFKDLSG